MNKIPTCFIRDPENMQYVLDVKNPDCLWVFNGEGSPTVKKDGTNIMVTIKNGNLVTVKKRKNPSREEKARGAEPGYIDANREDPADKHIFSAVDNTDFLNWPNGSWPCEAIGPKIQGGAEGPIPKLYAFSICPEYLGDFERTYATIREVLSDNCIEGIVWHHPDGRMAKIKRRDFGLKWPDKGGE